MLFGIPCMGCGLTHSTLCLLKGQFRESLSYCPLTVFVLLSLASAMLLHFRLCKLPPMLLAAARFLATSRMWYAVLLLAFAVLYSVRMALYFPNGPYPMLYNERNFLRLLLDGNRNGTDAPDAPENGSCMRNFVILTNATNVKSVLENEDVSGASDVSGSGASGASGASVPFSGPFSGPFLQKKNLISLE